VFGRYNSLSKTTVLAAVATTCLLVVLPLLPGFSREDIRAWLVAALLLSGMAVAFDFTAGYIGVVNFGFAAFSGIGAYVTGLVALHAHVSPMWAIGLGALSGATLGFLVGLLTLRFRGIYASIIPFFLALALMGVVRNWTSLTRGPLGLTTPILFDSPSNLPYYYACGAMLLLAFVVMGFLVRSRVGLAFRALGQSMEAAKASGVSPARYRILNYTISCLFAGMFGGFYSFYYGVLTPDVLSTSITVSVMVAAYLGGRGTLWGPALAAIPLSLGTSWMNSNLTDYAGLNLVIYGALLIVAMVYFPRGLVGILLWARAAIVKGMPVLRRARVDR
jgi:branched-chain amino acid transport system permease protein